MQTHSCQQPTPACLAHSWYWLVSDHLEHVPMMFPEQDGISTRFLVSWTSISLYVLLKICLIKLSVPQILYHQIRELVNKKLKKLWKQAVMPNMRYYLGICLESQRTTSIRTDASGPRFQCKIPCNGVSNHYNLLGIQRNEVAKIIDVWEEIAASSISTNNMGSKCL